MIAELPYYSRSPLDQQCLGHLGLNKGVSMFAPRRRGKTWFVLHELLPAAENHGYQTLYIDLWEREHEPERAIVEALEEAGNKRRYMLASTKFKASIKPPFAEVGAEIEAKPKPEGEDDMLGRLKKSMSNLSTKQPWLIVIDEFQALANTKTPGFIAALRTALQTHPKIKVFLTGSSRRGLANLLASQKSPFLGMAMPVDLPDLDQSFIKNRCDVIRERTGRKIPVAPLLNIFERLLLVPEYLNQIVSIIIVEGLYDVDAAYTRWKQVLAEGVAAKLWESLTEHDMLVLTILAHQPGTAMFSEATRRWIQAQLKGAQINSSNMQGVVRRLNRAGLVQQGETTGAYELANDEMRLFITEVCAHPKTLPPKPKRPSNTRGRMN